jgi:hypothetical protein
MLDYGYSASNAITLLAMNSTWKYSTNNLDGQAWTNRAFNDSAWASGPGLLYVETNTAVSPRNTLLPGTAGALPPTYYFRAYVNVTTNLSNATLAASTMVDDGAAIYINGNPVQRIRLNAGATYNSTATGSPSGGDAVLETWSWSGTNLIVGTNVIAAEVHQDSATSSDIVWGMSLVANIIVANVPPIITNQPVSQIVAPGANATFSVGAYGTPTLTYQWRSNGLNILGARSATYTITNVQRAQVGFYSVVIRNAYDVNISDSAALGLALPPELSGKPVVSGGQFQMTLYGNPGVNYVLEASSNLTAWSPLVQFTNFNGQAAFSDPETTNRLRRFFRLRQF